MLRQVIKTSFLLLVLLVGFIGGFFFHRHVHVSDLLVNLGLRQPFNTPSLSSQPGPLQPRELPDLTADESAFVGLVLGQSNAGSHGALDRNDTLSLNAYQFWLGDYYPAQDPLYGSSGEGGSIWTSLTPELLNQHTSVVWAATVVGATSIKEWIPGGRFEKHLNATLVAVNEELLPVDAVFWIQGETDAQALVTQDAYYQALTELLDLVEKSLPDTPVYLAKATRCYQRLPYAPIRDAIDQAVANFPLARAGIDLDEIGLGYRFDGCHLTLEGQQLAARRWSELLQTAD